MADRARDLAALTRGKAARIARSEYVRLERELRREGLNAAVMARHAAELTEWRGQEWMVIERAYVPTGAALGCPLDAQTTANLRRLVTLIDRRIAAIARTERPVLARVPPEAYHVTIVNRAHYERSAPSFMTPDEFAIVRDCIARLALREIEVVVYGFMLTAHGKLFLKGLPADERLLELRMRLIEALPALKLNLPMTAHMKLAHLRPVPAAVATEVQAMLKHLDDHVLQRVVFRDVFTTHGRIPL